MTTIQAASFTQRDKKSRMVLVFTTCMGMSGNGYKMTGMIIMRALRLIAKPGQIILMQKWFAVAHTEVLPGLPVQPPAAVTLLTADMLCWDFGLQNRKS